MDVVANLLLKQPQLINRPLSLLLFQAQVLQITSLTIKHSLRGSQQFALLLGLCSLLIAFLAQRLHLLGCGISLLGGFLSFRSGLLGCTLLLIPLSLEFVPLLTQ